MRTVQTPARDSPVVCVCCCSDECRSELVSGVLSLLKAEWVQVWRDCVKEACSAALVIGRITPWNGERESEHKAEVAKKERKKKSVTQ